MWNPWKKESATAVEEPVGYLEGGSYPGLPPGREEGEPAIEGEFRYVGNDNEDEESEEERRRREREVGKEFADIYAPEEPEKLKPEPVPREREKRADIEVAILEAQLRAELAQAQKARRETGETRWGRFERGAKAAHKVGKGTSKVASVGYKIATLGGPISMKKERKHLYVPEPREDLYFVGGGRGKVRSTSLREVSEPKLEKLRQAGALHAGAKLAEMVAPPRAGGAMGASREGLISVQGQNVSLGLLREQSLPRGLTRIEKYAYAEIVGNGDRDTAQHVVSELASMGVPRRQAEAALKSLLERGVVRREHDRSGQPPVLEVIR